MSGAVSAVAATKGLRGVAQDFLAPELRALTERVQGFENLNKSRFDDVDRRFEDVNRRFDEVDRRIDELRSEMDRRFAALEVRMERLELRMDRLEAEIVAMPDKIGLHIDRLISSLDLSNRLAAVERDRTPRLPAL